MIKRPKTTPRYKWKLLGVAPTQYAIYIVAIALARLDGIINKKPVEKLPNTKRYRIVDHVFIQHKKRKANEKNRLINRSNGRGVRGNTRAQHGNRKRHHSTKPPAV
ncbi:MAG: hypothetical protein [Bacteriophage sp.]|nr:MAG: hypothetical protein [Bacteriophage sp.]